MGVVATVGAQIPSGGIRVPADGQMPFYFSGTYCRASGYFGIESPPPGFNGDLYVEWATLSINGIIVDDYYDTPENPGLIDVSLGVIFDSTHFGDGTNVTIEMRAMDSADRLYEVQDIAPVKNKALAWGHYFNGNGEDGADEAHAGFLASNINSSVNIGTWDPYLYFNAMSGASCVYVCTHGNVGVHEAGDGSLIYSTQRVISGTVYSGYKEEREAAIGYGYPPFNSTEKPPLWLLMICDCMAGDTNAFSTGLIPYQNGYGEWLADQVLWAYRVT